MGTSIISDVVEKLFFLKVEKLLPVAFGFALHGLDNFSSCVGFQREIERETEREYPVIAITAQVTSSLLKN